MRTMWKASLAAARAQIVTGFLPGVEPENWVGPDATCGLDPNGEPAVWVLVDTDHTDDVMLPRRFILIGTGHPVPPGQVRMIGSITQRAFVWHVVELLP